MTTRIAGYLTHVPSASTTLLADRRWGADIYHCEPLSDGKLQCPGGYGLASMCGVTGRSSAPGWHSNYPQDWTVVAHGWTRGLATHAAIVERLRDRLAPKPRRLPSWRHELEQAARREAQRTTRSSCDARSLLRGSLRPLVAQLVADGKAWSSDLDHWAPRRVQAEAKAILAPRSQRRADRAAAEAARRGQPGRIAALVPVYAARRAEALRRRIEPRVLAAYERCDYRVSRVGAHSVSVQLGAPSAHGESSRGEPYSRRCTYRRTDSEHRLVVRPDWVEAVYDQDLEVVDGVLILAAEERAEGVYDVVYARQARGFTIETARGVVVRHAGEVHLGGSVRAAKAKCVKPYAAALAR